MHGQGNTWVEEPTDRLLSCEYQELEFGDPPQVKKWCEETWRYNKEEEVAAATKKFGPCPERL